MRADLLSNDSVYPLTPPKVSNIMAIASGKGGVGKTVVSSTLAHALSLKGKSVLLFDGDLGLANVDVQLGLMPEHDLGSVIAGHVDLQQAICRYGSDTDIATAPPKGSFDILAGKSGSGALNSLRAGQLRNITNGLTSLSPHYDAILIDLPAGIDASVTQLSTLCKTVYVVLTDEPTSLTDAYAYIKVISRHDPQADFRVIVNQVTKNSDGERAFGSLEQACQNFLGKSIVFAGTVRRDTKVKDAIRHQMPILKRSPDSQAGSDLRAIAAHICEWV